MTDPTRLDPDFSAFDLIGDVHGCARTLQALLELLGYRYHRGVWRHPRRVALFTGDLVDRGPQVRETLLTVRAMVAAGAALLVPGNHEYNLLGWYAPAPEGSGQTWLRPHTSRNHAGLAETLEAFEGHPRDLADTLAWLRTLPLWLESPALRVVHACWDGTMLEQFCASHEERTLSESLTEAACWRGSLARRFLDRLLNGTALQLPESAEMVGRDGVRRSWFRTAFWVPEPRTLGEAAFQPDPLPSALHHQPLDAAARDRLLVYPASAPPVFFGHYWLSGRPHLQADNVCCLDYSSVLGGRLVAYRFDGERRLDPSHFVWVEHQD